MRSTPTWHLPLACLGLVVVALSGCASMSKSECAAVDWKTIGYEDGAAGRSGERIADHRRACVKYGVVPDLDLYQVGRQQGLREYCRPENGYRVGVSGGSYEGLCPAEMGDAFVNAYDSGRKLYSLRRRVTHNASQIEYARNEIDHAEHEIIERAVVLVSTDASGEARAQALVSTQQLAERVGRLKAKVSDLERDQARYERELAEYRTANSPTT